MAEIPFNLGFNPQLLTPAQMGVPDYVGAMQKGFEAGAKPAQLSENLLATMLANRLKSTQAQFAAPQALSQLAQRKAQRELSQGELGLLPYKKALLEAQRTRQLQLASQPVLSPIDKARYEAQAKQDVKDITALEEQIPAAQKELQKVNRAIEIAQEHPEWFGPGVPGLGFTGLTGPEGRKRKINNPDYGVLEATTENLVGSKAQELSHGNRVLATAFGLAGKVKPSLAENPMQYLGKMYQIRDELAQGLNLHHGRYKKAGGTLDFSQAQFIPRTEFTSKQDFHDYMISLSPSQRKQVIAMTKKKKEASK